MLYVSAQNDSKYMLWQLCVQLSNFRRLGIEQHAVALIAYDGYPSPYIDNIRHQTRATILTYPDDRADKTYMPSIYFDLVGKYLADVHVTQPILFHDNDIIFREVPAFDVLSADSTHYFSDCTNYLGHHLYDRSAIESMAGVLGMTYDSIAAHPTSGGAQYFFKTHDAGWWKQLAVDAPRMHRHILTIPPVPGKRLDAWTAGMWTLQWSAWREGMVTDVHPELNFTWPTYAASTWDTTKILHNAGVAPGQSHEMFHKGSYAERSPFNDDLSYVSRDYASWYYAQEVRNAAAHFYPGF